MGKKVIFRKKIFNGLLIILVLLIIVIGGLTRLTESGLSMVDWELLRGIIPPFTEQAWQEEFANYKKYPEFQEKNYLISLEEFKVIFYFEYAHRMLGRLLGLGLLFTFLYFFLKRELSFKEIMHYAVLLFLVMMQGLLGWYMVKSGLVNEPEVSHYRLAAHLSLALFLLMYLWKFWLSYFSFKKDRFFNSNKLINLLIILIAGQIILGAFNSGLDAGIISHDYPKMLGQWIPYEQFGLEKNHLTFFASLKELSDNAVFIHFIHRHLGLLLGIVLLVFSSYFFLKVNTFDIKIALLLLFLLSFIQPLIGIFLTVSSIPIPLASLHQIIAVFILLNVVYLKHRTSSR